MIKGYIFDYGATLDTAGQHWGKVLWHAYERQNVPINESDFRDAYVYGERTLGSSPLIKHDYTFRKTLEIKLRLEFEYLCKKGLLNIDETSFNRLYQVLLEDVYSQVPLDNAHEDASTHHDYALLSSQLGRKHLLKAPDIND